ncbi:MAG: hypothetical protein AAFR99_05730 [Cyanobacteria bacterium J06629_9]
MEDALLSEWRQGDFVLGDYLFIYQTKLRQSLTADQLPEAEDVALMEAPVRGFVVVTQTCDIVRSVNIKPFIQVSPLVEVERERLQEVKRCRRPRYAYVSGAESLYLVADLDRTMTVDKAVAVSWSRQSGCSDDQELISFGKALARHRKRFAFPDDFVAWSEKLQKRFKSKHSKSSDEGDALRQLREIRVKAVPSWDHNEVDLMFWFIREEGDINFRDQAWYTFLDPWLDLLAPHDRFTVNGQIVTLEDMTAKDYVESVPLDLDYLSS